MCKRRYAREPDTIRFTPQEAAIFGALLKRLNRVVQKDFLRGEMYPHEQDEPDDAERNLRVQVSKIRHKIDGVPITIKNVWGTGYIASGYVEINWDGL